MKDASQEDTRKKKNTFDPSEEGNRRKEIDRIMKEQKSRTMKKVERKEQSKLADSDDTSSEDSVSSKRWKRFILRLNTSNQANEQAEKLLAHYKQTNLLSALFLRNKEVWVILDKQQRLHQFEDAISTSPEEWPQAHLRSTPRQLRHDHALNLVQVFPLSAPADDVIATDTSDGSVTKTLATLHLNTQSGFASTLPSSRHDLLSPPISVRTTAGQLHYREQKQNQTAEWKFVKECLMEGWTIPMLKQRCLNEKNFDAFQVCSLPEVEDMAKQIESSHDPQQLQKLRMMAEQYLTMLKSNVEQQLQANLQPSSKAQSVVQQQPFNEDKD